MCACECSVYSGQKSTLDTLALELRVTELPIVVARTQILVILPCLFTGNNNAH